MSLMTSNAFAALSLDDGDGQSASRAAKKASKKKKKAAAVTATCVDGEQVTEELDGGASGATEGCVAACLRTSRLDVCVLLGASLTHTPLRSSPPRGVEEGDESTQLALEDPLVWCVVGVKTELLD